jgi:hypothetical protein
MGESRKDSLRVDFDKKLKLEFHGTKVTSEAGLLAFGLVPPDHQGHTKGTFSTSCKTSDFLDKSCHQNDTTNTDFAQIEQGWTSIFHKKANIL